MSGYAVITGPAWVLREQHTYYDILKGTQIVSVYEGSPAGIAQVKAGLRNWERAEEDSSDSPRIRLTVTSPDLAEATVWDLVTTLKQKEARQSPSYRLGSVSARNMQILDLWFQGLDANASDPAPATPAWVTDSTETAAGILWNLELTKETYFTEDVVLRYTTTVTNARQIALAYANSKKIFTHTQILTPSVSGLYIPAGIVVSMNQANADAEATSDTYQTWGWLKMKPQSRQRVIGKVEITGDFWLGLHNNKLYGTV